MTTRVGSATGTNTATMPTHAVGDLIVAFAFRDGSTTGPSIPSEGWIPLAASSSAVTQAGTTCSAVMVVKRADSASEAVGTFTNATFVGVVVYRGDTGKQVGIGTWGFQAGTASTVTYPADTLIGASSTSWVAAFAGHRSVNTNLQTAPTNMSNVANFVDATNEGAIHDTNTTAASWPSTGVAVGGTASGWITAVFEVREFTHVLSRYQAVRDHVSDNGIIPCIGHSLMAGALAAASNPIASGYLQQLASDLTACVARSTDASFMGDQNATAFGMSPAVFNTNLGLGTFAAGGGGTLGARAFTPGSAGTLTFDPDVAFDRLRVFYARYVGSPEYTVNVDGGSSLGTLNMNDTPAAYASETFSVTDTTHQVRIVAAATGGFIGGVLTWRSTVKQLTFLNCAWAGGLTTDFLSTADVYQPLVALRTLGTVPLTLIHFDANEIIGSGAVETFRFNLAVLTLERLFYGDVGLISSAYMSATASGMSEVNQANYHNVVRDWADVMGCAYVRGTAQPGLSTFAAGDALGYYDADGIHMPTAGYTVAYATPLLALLDAGLSPITGTVAVTDGDDTSSATAGVKVSGSSAVSDDADTSSATGAVRVSGTVAVSDGDDVSAASGTVGSAAITGTVAVTDGDDTSSATGAVRISGTVAVSDGDDTSNASGTVGAAAITGTVAVTDGADTSAATGAVRVSGTVAVNDNDDISSATGAARVSGTVAVTDDPDVSAVAGAVRISGAVAVTDGADISDARERLPPITGYVAANDGPDVSDATGFVELTPGTYALAIGGGGTVFIQDIDGTPTVVGGSITFTGSVVAGALRGRP